eukprot:gnl/Dysnectes_brevis/1945_a2235_2063.p1 GENE.gnl/Dysnectes_brevis/1945_a2235_2063~~gnl/Dysnectes_brevis/1945_a2235_2063.p1  ORF type:complete len:215 (+),score=11.69 gnl/Dysnectes_brevis/1945_a2235_2063:72-647(+)
MSDQRRLWYLTSNSSLQDNKNVDIQLITSYFSAVFSGDASSKLLVISTKEDAISRSFYHSTSFRNLPPATQNAVSVLVVNSSDHLLQLLSESSSFLPRSSSVICIMSPKLLKSPRTQRLPLALIRHQRAHILFVLRAEEDHPDPLTSGWGDLNLYLPTPPKYTFRLSGPGVQAWYQLSGEQLHCSGVQQDK